MARCSYYTIDVNGIFNLVNIKQVAVDATSKGSIYNAQWVFSAAFFNPYQKGYLDIVYCTPPGRSIP